MNKKIQNLFILYTRKNLLKFALFMSFLENITLEIIILIHFLA